MVSAWFMDSSTEDQRLPHKRDGNCDVSLDELAMLGVVYYKLDATNYNEGIQKIRDERGYTYMDEIACKKGVMENYEAKLKAFFEEHLHADEEVRFVADGSGYFDVRDRKDQWIRIHVEAGDLLVLPAGIYHRFTLDYKKRTLLGS